jgi:hypothetical protein
MDRFRAQNYKIIERYASLIQYFLYLELIFVPLQQNEKDSVSGFSCREFFFRYMAPIIDKVSF